MLYRVGDRVCFCHIVSKAWLTVQPPGRGGTKKFPYFFEGFFSRPHREE